MSCMPDPSDCFPDLDLFDRSDLENFINFQENDDFNFAEFSSLAEPDSCCPSLPKSSDGMVGDFDPLDNLLTWDICGTDTVANPNAGTSEIYDEISNPEIKNPTPENIGFRNSMQLSMRPHPAVPFQCSFCQVLREIIHTNGNHATKLEIHGRLGMICHAIVENQDGHHEYQMFDLSKQSLESVKQFLQQYCDERKQAGYIMLQDPLLMFYEVLCTGLDWDEDFDLDTPAGPFSSEEFQVNEPYSEDRADIIQDGERIPKGCLAAQRERAAKLTMRDVGKYFNFPIGEAAKRVGVCPTVVKKICRRNGLHRWPHRKIKSMERKLSILQGNLKSGDAQVRAHAQEAIEKLRRKLNDIYAGVAW